MTAIKKLLFVIALVIGGLAFSGCHTTTRHASVRVYYFEDSRCHTYRHYHYHGYYYHDPYYHYRCRYY